LGLGAADRPQELSEDSRGERERADVGLLAALDAAPPGGLSAAELAARIGRSRAWVFSRLDVHASAGRAVRLRRGRWTGRAER
jgi:S-DNA-T family DNA segregation ATPase FtsK/SpoIIIE